MAPQPRAPISMPTSGRLRDGARIETARAHHFVACKPRCSSPSGRRMAPRSIVSVTARSRPAAHAVPLGAKVRRDLYRAGRRRCRRRPAAISQGRVRRISRLRHLGPRFTAPALWRLRPRQTKCLQLQAARLLPHMRGSALAQTAARLVDHVFPRVPAR